MTPIFKAFGTNKPREGCAHVHTNYCMYGMFNLSFNYVIVSGKLAKKFETTLLFKHGKRIEELSEIM